MSWQFQADQPIYTQLVARLQQQIVSGVYPPGCKLPSVRDLASDAGVNPNTVQRGTDLHAAHRRQVRHRGCSRRRRCAPLARRGTDPAVSRGHARAWLRKAGNSQSIRSNGGTGTCRSLNAARWKSAMARPWRSTISISRSNPAVSLACLGQTAAENPP